MSDSFLDIAPGKVVVPISGKQIEVDGLPLRSLASLLLGYPSLVEVLFVKEKRSEVTAMDIAKVAPDAVIDIILYGIGMADNKKARAIAENLPSGEQIILLSIIIKRSIGEGGFGPLVEHVEDLAAMAGPLRDVDADVEVDAAVANGKAADEPSGKSMQQQ